MIEFISTLYNESAEVEDLVVHIYPLVDKLNIIDDGSTDDTARKLEEFGILSYKVNFKTIEHTGLCELGRIEALKMCQDDSWIIMLDADERFTEDTFDKLEEFFKNPGDITHIFFSQKEFIDGKLMAEFAKVKVFKKSVAHLPEIIHRDPQFDGEPTNIGGTVIHRKTSNKQVMRELEYLQTYDNLLDAGKVTQSDVDWFKGMHHYVRDRHG